MAEIIRFNKLIENLGRRQREAARMSRTRLRVGYTAPYAWYVHEDLEAHHDVGQAKFLSQPYREYEHTMAKMIRRDVQNNKLTLAQALLRAGQFLLEKSKELVPVDTGYLKESGFVWIEQG